ncbi:MAG: cupin domain-containing protein [Synechococcaceae cyanobacterium]|nr:cupin domain-containing protein [Synechococcaceae cyanobacterium]
MPAGMAIPSHHHEHWCQVFVVSGTMAVQADGEELHTIGAGGFYFVEPGDTHAEAAMEDSLLLVICEEERPQFRRHPWPSTGAGARSRGGEPVEPGCVDSMGGSALHP